MKHGPLSKAYEFRSLPYILTYQAINALAVTLEDDPAQGEVIAQQYGVTTDELYKTLEELYTDNADPDNDETN